MGRFSCPCGLQCSMGKRVAHSTSLGSRAGCPRHGVRQGKTMAKITFSIEEFTQVLISNELLRGEILRPKVEGDRIHFVIKTNSFILPYIPASLGYLGFSDNLATFELTIVSSYLNKAVSRLKQMLQLKIPSYMRLEYPKIFVDVDNLLKEKNIRGVRVKDVSLEGGNFTITTCNI